MESTVFLLQQHVKSFQKQVSVLESKNEEQEQYRTGLRVEGVLPVEYESYNDVLNMVKSLITESGREIME